MMHLFLGLFIILSLLHLIACFKHQRIFRILTKPPLLCLLALWYMHVAGSPATFVIVALFLGCLGDILLMPIDAFQLKAQGLGAFTFLVGHFFYLAHIIPRLAPVSPWLWVVLAVCVVGGLLLNLSKLLPALGKNQHFPKKIMKIGVSAYLGILHVLILCAGIFAFSGFSVLPVAGAILFVVSDTILLREALIGETRYSTFFVMLTYLSAQFLLAWGLM